MIINMENKIKAVRKILADKKINGILIERQNNFTWFTGGRGFIGLAAEIACGSILVTKDDVVLVANNIEADRLATEEIADKVTVKKFFWYEDTKRNDIIKELTGSNFLTDAQLGNEFFALRTTLTESEISDYEIYGKIATAELEAAMISLKAGTSEFELAGLLSQKLWKYGIEPTTLLIAFDERIKQYRHPLPTKNTLSKTAMAAICVRYKGLFISSTRLVNIGELSDELKAKHNAVCAVDAVMITETVKGAKFGDIFEKVKAEYKNVGYADQWQYHHQGGLTGYVGREMRILPNSDFTVAENQAYAYNPTITGTKNEDTIITTGSGNKVITHTDSWEYLNVKGVLRPNILSI